MAEADDWDELPSFDKDAAGGLNVQQRELSERARKNADEGGMMGGAQRGAQHCSHGSHGSHGSW